MNKNKIYAFFIIVGAVFLLFYWVNEFYESKISKLNKDLFVKIEKLQKVKGIYDNIKTSTINNSTDLSLMVFLQDVTAKLDISEKIVFLKPKPSDNSKEMVSLRLERLNLNNLIIFLSELDKYSNINIPNMSVIKRFDEPEFADLNIEISKL